MKTKKVLLTSVCRPFGEKYGDAPSVGYELLHGQVTRAQGIFSPRAVHLYFSLEYIAENMETPAVVLHYPSRKELIRELKKGYDYVGVSFILAVFHKMKETVALIRRYSPRSKIVLGGYGTVLSDEALADYADHICREEGVSFFRKLLGEPEIPMPYKHPLIVSKLRFLSVPVSNTGMIFAGLGCANGCDFCCTSHFFKRKHIKLLPDGKDIYAVIERYLDIDPNMSFTILDEDFLLNKRRAMEFRDCVLRKGRQISVFVFASIRAISQYTIQEILEMGIDGFWIGYEAPRSGYGKQAGQRPVEELFQELREHGITILASMIVGFDYQDEQVIRQEFDGLMKLRPCYSQFLIYGPTPGTPFYQRVLKEGLFHDDCRHDPEGYYRRCDGFSSMVKHPRLSPLEIESMQRWCYDEDFQRLGPSVFRSIERWFLAYRKLKDSPQPFLAAKAQRFAREVRKAYPVFLAARLFGPNPRIRGWVRALQLSIWQEFGKPTFGERTMALGAVCAAAWTWLTLKLDVFQHPGMVRSAYRMPEEGWGRSRLWEDIPAKVSIPGLSIRVEMQYARKLVWLRLEGRLAARDAERLWAQVSGALAKCRSRVVLDFQNLHWEAERLAPGLRTRLADYRSRVRLVLPKLSHAHPEVLVLAKFFSLYKEKLFF